MKIKHIETGIETTVTHNKWLVEYVKKGKYKKYEILQSKDVIELHHEKDDGSTSVTVMGNEGAKMNMKNFPNRFVVKDNTWKYCDKYLINKPKNQSFLKKIFFRIKEIIRPNAIPKEKKVAFTRYEWFTISLMLIGSIIIPIWLNWDKVYPKLETILKYITE